MILSKQIKLILLIPILCASTIVIMVTIFPWFSYEMAWMDQIQSTLVQSKLNTMQMYTWATSQTISAEFQQLSSKQTSIANLLSKIYQGQVKQDNMYQEQTMNILDNNTQTWYISNQEHKIYTSGYYSPQGMSEQLVRQKNLFYLSEFLMKSIQFSLKSASIQQNQYYLISEQDGSTQVLPVMYLNPQPSQEVDLMFDEYYQNCSYNEIGRRKYFYEFRCLPSFISAIKDNGTNVMFNMPVLGLKNSKLDISADICTKLNFAYDVRFVLCSTYETQKFLVEKLNKTKVWKTYVIYAGTRIPLIYDLQVNESRIKSIKNIEDWEYKDIGFINEKRDYLEKTKQFESVFNVSDECNKENEISVAQSFYIKKNNLNYQIYLRNLSVCTRGEYGIQEQIIGTIVNEVSVLDEEFSVLMITGKINKQIQISISIILILLILTVFAINFYSSRLVIQITNPIDELIFHLRNIDEQNIETYFVEYLQGPKKDNTPYEMELLIKSVYDFVGLVRNAYHQLAQGNDFEALMGYSAAYSFYQQNENYMGSGVILNNIGVIHVNHKRYLEALLAFYKSVDYIEYEIQKYEDKYLQYGIQQDELFIDLDYKNIQQIKYYRLLNLSECLVSYLQTIPQQFYNTIEKERQISQYSIQDILNQVENDEQAYDSKDIITFQELQSIHELLIQSCKNQYLSQHEILQNLWNKAIQYYMECKSMLPKLTLNQSQQILLNFRIINCYLSFQDFEKCQDLLNHNKNLLQDQSLNNHSILLQKYHLYMGLYYTQIKLPQQAAIEFTSSIKIQGQFNARDRLHALKQLAKLLPKHLIQPYLDKYQKQTKRILFLLDNTNDMQKDRSLIRAIQTVRIIIDSLEHIQIAYGIINQEYKEMIPLISKQENYPFIKKILEYVPISEPYECDLEFGILTSQNVLLQNNDKTDKKFIIVLCRNPISDIDLELQQQLIENDIEMLVVFMDNEQQIDKDSRYKQFSEINLHKLRQYLMSFEIKLENENESYNIEQTI